MTVTTNEQPEPAGEPAPEAVFAGWGDADDVPRPDEALIVNLDGFEGPLDLLLALAAPRRWISPGSRCWRWPSSTLHSSTRH